MRQLLPVGLLVAATGAGVAAAPVIGSTASADGRHHGGGRAVTQAGPDTSPQPGSPQAATAPAVAPGVAPGSGLVPAAYVLPSGRHRAAVVGEPLAASTGGKHRAGSGTHGQRGHTAKTTSTSTTATPGAAATAAPTATAAATATSSASSASATSGRGAATAGSGSTPGGLVAGLVGTVTDAVGGLLGGTD